MNLSRIFILRPVATVLMMVGVVLTGLTAYFQLPLSALPQIDYPTIQVVTFYPGAGPDVVASAITAPLERQFGQVPGLTQMTSSSSDGCSVITLRFALDLNIDVASQQVQAAINVASTLLPRDLPNPPIYTKSNPADAPVLTLALTSSSLPLHQVYDFADTRLAQKISQLPGVGLVSLSGGQKPAIRVQVNPTALSSLGLGMEDVRLALVQANVNQAKGSFDGIRQAFIISANDQLLTGAQYESLVVSYRGGRPVVLKDVATIVEGVENLRQRAWFNTQPALLVNIQRQPGANIISVVDRIKGLLKELEESFPPSINIRVLTDRTVTIRAAIEDVHYELFLTVALVVLVIFVFLGDLPATTIPSVAVPLSIIGTFGVMYLLGYSLNNLTLMALTISTGFVVDDAIVVVENIMRYIEEGMSPLAAALKGSQQIGFTILSLSISLVAVLIPLLFMSDIVGRLFREFAVTLSVSILISAVVSLTLTPMMCAYILSSRHGRRPSLTTRIADTGFGWILAAYRATLVVVFRNQTLTLAVAVITLLGTAWLYTLVGRGFFPSQDTGLLLGIAKAPPGISFAAMGARQLALHEVILRDPAVASLSGFIGVDGINTTLNSGRIQINLKPLAERQTSANKVIKRLQEAVRNVEGIQLFLQPVQDLTVETRVSSTQFQYSLETPDQKELFEWAPRFATALAELPQLQDVASDQETGAAQMQVVIDRDLSARLGITPQMIDDALYDAFGQRQVSIMFTQSNQYRLVLEVEPAFRDSPDDLQRIYVRTSSGATTPLATIASFERTSGPLSLQHQGQFPVVTLSFNLAPGVPLGAAVDAIAKVRQTIDMPESVVTSFQGTAKAFEASLTNTPLLILAALVTVYIVLGVLYESYIHPITILSTLPSAGAGALLALLWAGLELNVISLIGIILLIGIVKKNAIMMIDFALEAERTQGKSPTDAMFEACLLRLRPILMTTMAALLGAVPLAVGGGVGSELRQPLGITIIGGLLVSQLLTLYTTPIIYLWFDRLAKRLGFLGTFAVPDSARRFTVAFPGANPLAGNSSLSGNAPYPGSSP